MGQAEGAGLCAKKETSIGSAMNVGGLSLAFALVSCCLNASVMAQDTLTNHWPKHAVTFSMGFAHQFGLSTAYTYGPQRDLTIRGKQTGIGLEYGFKTSKGLLFGAMAQIVTSSWRYNFNLDEPRHGVVGYPGMNSPPAHVIAFWFYHPEFTLHAGKRLVARRRWSVDAGVMAGIIPLWSKWLIRNDGYGVDIDTNYIRVIDAAVEEGVDIHPLIGCRVQLNWQARNYNRWSLMFEGRMTPTNYYDGDYTLYRDNPTQAGGILRGRMGYVGLRVGFGITWGEPRKPRWLRLDEKYGLPNTRGK